MDKNVRKVTVAVLLPVYNAQRYLREAIDSILEQTYHDFDFYIINDGSSDGSEDIILSYNDIRIRYIKNDKNQGLIYTLNLGLDLIKADYIVRMDADDIALPERIEKQVQWMERHKDAIVCGTQIQYFGEVNKVSEFFQTHDDIQAQHLFGSGMAHPSVIIRNQVFEEYKLKYNTDYLHLEDYELWTRAAKYGKLANLPEILLKYRLEGQNITVQNWSTREERMKSVYKKLLMELEVEPHEDNLKLHLELGCNTQYVRDIGKLIEYTKKLLSQNNKMNIYSQIALGNFIAGLWKQLFFKVPHSGLRESLRYWFYTRSVSLTQLHYFIGVYKTTLMKTSK